ncbi:MAG TPA: hypothetical protein VEQ10_05870, partial [Vicinamibacteria bacterium]|nr:hypothetical protein [Vicinamibacteria bacterium]
MSPLEPTADGLFTAEDLFGDLVDAPPPSRSDPPQRPAPIRVQVNEPAAPPKAARSLSEVPPEEMAALINAIGDASVPAPAPVVEPEPPGEPEITITVDEDVAEPSPSETPTHPFDLDALLPSPAAVVSEDPAPADGSATVADLSLSGLD